MTEENEGYCSWDACTIKRPHEHIAPAKRVHSQPSGNDYGPIKWLDEEND